MIVIILLLILLWFNTKAYVFRDWGLPNMSNHIWKFSNMKLISNTGTMQAEILVYLPLLPKTLQYNSQSKFKKLQELYALSEWQTETCIISYDEITERICIKARNANIAFEKFHKAFQKCYIQIPNWASSIMA